jgi:hemerythrin-like domain-containing protein
MDLQSFTLGIVSVVISIMIGVIIFTFLRVQRYRKEITSLKEDLRHTHNFMSDSLQKTQDRLSKIMEEDRQEMFKMFDDSKRNLNLVKEDIQSKESSLTSHINQRFDKFENRLNTSCFKSNNDDTLYS